MEACCMHSSSELKLSLLKQEAGLWGPGRKWTSKVQKVPEAYRLQEVETVLWAVIIAARRRQAELPTCCAGSVGDGAPVSCHLSSGEVFGGAVAFESRMLLHITPDPCCGNSNKLSGSLSWTWMSAFSLSSVPSLWQLCIGSCPCRKRHITRKDSRKDERRIQGGRKEGGEDGREKADGEEKGTESRSEDERGWMKGSKEVP